MKRARTDLALLCGLASLATSGPIYAKDLSADATGTVSDGKAGEEQTPPNHVDPGQPTANQATTARQPQISPVSIMQPVGSVRLAVPGDEIGPRRYADRRSSGTMALVRISLVQPRSEGSRGSPLGGTIGLPVTGRVSSGFGQRVHPVTGARSFHAGVDISVPAGTPIHATIAGTVVHAGWRGGYGLLVAIGSGDEVETRYAHLSQLAVAVGQSIDLGDVIGFVGSTGRSTGPHLHYEVRQSGVAQNPGV